MVKLYFHAGLPKCSSSSVQDYLYYMNQNNKNFQERFTYPSCYVDEIDLDMYNHNLYTELISKRDVDLKIKSIVEKSFLGNRLKAGGVTIDSKFVEKYESLFLNQQFYKDVIMSSETVLKLPEQSLKLLFERLENLFDDIDILLLIRDPLKRAESHIQQAVKWGGTIENELLSYEHMLCSFMNLIDALKNYRIHVIDIENKNSLNEIQKFFNFDYVLEINANKSLNNESVRKISKLNKQDKKFVLRDNLWKQEGDKFKLTSEEINKISNILQLEYQFIKDQFGIEYEEKSSEKQ